MPKEIIIAVIGAIGVVAAAVAPKFFEKKEEPTAAKSAPGSGNVTIGDGNSGTTVITGTGNTIHP